MSKTDDIPDDVWKSVQAEAMKFVEWLTPEPDEYEQAEHVLSVSFARAIMAERERCAKIAERGVPTKHPRVFNVDPSAVAHAIRKGE